MKMDDDAKKMDGLHPKDTGVEWRDRDPVWLASYAIYYGHLTGKDFWAYVGEYALNSIGENHED